MYNVRTYRVEIVVGKGVSGMSQEDNATHTQFRLRDVRLAVDPAWAPFREISILTEGVRCVRYVYQDNEEDVSCPRLWEAAPRSLRQEWNRLLRAVRIEMGRRRVTEWLHRAVMDLDNGGVLLEEDLEREGLHPGSTKTRPGYWSKNLGLVESLEVYTGVYGVGLVQKIPRYDTTNYHFVKYWLYDLEEVQTDG